MLTDMPAPRALGRTAFDEAVARYFGAGGYPADHRRALELFKKAARQGVPRPVRSAAFPGQSVQAGL